MNRDMELILCSSSFSNYMTERNRVWDFCRLQVCSVEHIQKKLNHFDEMRDEAKKTIVTL